MVTIGVDITPIQGPHRMRGVGSTVINVMRHLSTEDREKHRFVLYLYDKDQQDALDLIKADQLPNYEVRVIEPSPAQLPSIKSMAGLLSIPARVRRKLTDQHIGDKHITSVDDLDVFLQFEQDVIPPRGVRSIVVAYDLIPYILESYYLYNYRTARHQHHYSRRAAFKAQLQRSLYLSKIKSAMNRADKIIAISKHTKQDFIKYLKLSEQKIDVIYLGVSESNASTQKKPLSVVRYTGTSWGDIKVTTSLPDTPFLLFVGGADPRRKLADLVYAFNLLRAQGNELHLVLAGDTMLGPNSIPNAEAKHALLSSSYLDDIYMLGFVDEATREWLYQNTLAFVYPSIYEGFGLPILEAMQYGSPVVTYRNSSILEIGGNKVTYADGFMAIANTCLELLAHKDSEVAAFINIKMEHTKAFTWTKTTQQILTRLTK